MGYTELLSALHDLFPEVRSEWIDQIVVFMIESGLLWNGEGIISMGIKGEEEFGRRNFETVVSTFNSPLLMTVLHGQKELGTVDPMSVRSNDGPSVLILAGRYWRVINVDWDAKIVWVEPSEDKGKAAWFGTSRSMSFGLCRMIHTILVDRVIPATMSKRAQTKLDELADAFSFLQDDETVVVSHSPNECRWWTFAGRSANLALADTCRRIGNKVVSFDNFSIRLKYPLEPFSGKTHSLIQEIDADTEKKLMLLSSKLKYSSCLPPSAQLYTLANRVRDTDGAEKIINQPLRIALSPDG